MVNYSWFVEHEVPRPVRKKKRRYRNPLDPKAKGQTGYLDDPLN